LQGFVVPSKVAQGSANLARKLGGTWIEIRRPFELRKGLLEPALASIHCRDITRDVGVAREPVLADRQFLQCFVVLISNIVVPAKRGMRYGEIWLKGEGLVRFRFGSRHSLHRSVLTK